MRYQARWKLRVRISQPTTLCLQILHESLGRDISCLITYGEIANDMPCIYAEDAQVWGKWFLSAAQVRYQRQTVVPVESCWYWGRRSAGASRHGNVLAMYCDKPSKINNARPSISATPCHHFEWRASGSDTLSRLGIVSIEDLIHFNHGKFWDKHLRLYELPNLTDLGRILARVEGASSDVNPGSLRKRARRWIARHTEEGNFVIQNALLKTPLVRKHLKTVSLSEWRRTVSEEIRRDGVSSTCLPATLI